MSGGFERRPGSDGEGELAGGEAPAMAPGGRTLTGLADWRFGARAAAGAGAARDEAEDGDGDGGGGDGGGGEDGEGGGGFAHPAHGEELAELIAGGPVMSAAPARAAGDDIAPGGGGGTGAGKPAAKPKIVPVKSTRSFKEYVVKPASPQVYDPLAGAKTLGGTDLAAVGTKGDEAKVLNALRKEDKRFNPAALIAAQRNLQVANATGAFNTETLRQLRAKTGDARLAGAAPGAVAGAILDEDLWKPFHTTPDVKLFLEPVSGVGTEKPDARATLRADRVAQAMGYKSYKSYSAQFQPFTFLGVKPGRGKDRAHPHLIARLQAAEAFLKQRHGADVTADKIGWTGEIVGTYHTDPEMLEKGAAHFHTMGLAVDFDPSINAWLYPQSELRRQTIDAQKAKNAKTIEANKAKQPGEEAEALLDAEGIAREWVKQQTNIMDVAFTQAGYLFNAVVLTKAKMMEWSETLSTEELHARIASAAAAFKQYYDLAKSGTDQQIIAKFVAAGFTAAQAREALPEMRKLPRYYDRGFSRDKTHGLPTTHSLDLMVALRDAAGLTFGGSEMSHGDNGDFMHFDCRNDPLGQRALQAMF